MRIVAVSHDLSQIAIGKLRNLVLWHATVLLRSRDEKGERAPTIYGREVESVEKSFKRPLHRGRLN
jgi:hypothetical protein